MKECDTNSDGELDRDEWKALSDRSLEAILERHALARGNDDESRSVHKSKCHGAFVLNLRVDLHAIDASTRLTG